MVGKDVSVQSESTSRIAYRPDIEGLRGIAILLIVLYHMHLPGTTGGYVGVDVFFVLSGYLISGLVLSEIESTGRFRLLYFYARRARRLIPAATLVIMATLFAGSLVYAPSEQRELARSALASSLYFSNIAFASRAVEYLATSTSTDALLHTWSLGAEEQFYLVWPILTLLALAYRPRLSSTRARFCSVMVLLVIVSFGLCVWMTQYSLPRAFFGTPYRVWEFALGGMCVLVPSQLGKRFRWAASPLSLAGLGLVLGADIAFGEESRFPGALALVPVAGTMLLLIAGTIETRAGAGRVLASAPMRWIGRHSYSWYLWHWPVLTLAAVEWGPLSVTARFGAVVLALGLSAITLATVENPVRKGRVFISRPGIAVTGALMLAMMCAVVAEAAGRAADYAANMPDQRAFTAAQEDVPRIEKLGCVLEEEIVAQVPPCIFGDTLSRTTVVLFGDSHAAHWFPAIERIALARGWSIRVFTKALCPPAAVEPFSIRLKRRARECSVWRRLAVRRILALHPALVAASSADFYVSSGGEGPLKVSPEEWRLGWLRTLSAFDSARVPTLLIQDAPLLEFDAPTCLGRAAAHHRRIASCSFGLAATHNLLAIDAEKRATEGLEFVSLVTFDKQICASLRCPVTHGDTVMYSDNQHLAARFVTGLARELEPVMVTTMGRTRIK